MIDSAILNFEENKYTKIYNNIVERATVRDIPTGYVEKHHIIPHSLGGTNLSENIVCLTAREHFICHWLLTKMVLDKKDKWKMTNALGMMMWGHNPHQERYKISSRLYEQLKKKHSELKSWSLLGPKNGFYGKTHSEETRKIMSEKAKGRTPWNKGKEYKGGGMTGKHHSKETKLKISKMKSLQTHTDEAKKKISDALLSKNIKRSDETRAKMSAAKKGIKHPRKTCEHCMKDTTVAMYARWHGDNCKLR